MRPVVARCVARTRPATLGERPQRSRAVNPAGTRGTIGLLGVVLLMNRMSGLTARGARALFPQALGRGLLEPIGGRRLAGLREFQLVFQKFDSLFAGIEADDQFPHLSVRPSPATPAPGLLPGAVNGLSLWRVSMRMKPWSGDRGTRP